MSALHVFEAGRGEAVVMLHGLPSPPADLEALAAELPGRRVIVPHLPGYGSTPARAGDHGVAAVESALIESLVRRGVERPVVVGYSVGGYRALSLALAVRARAVVCLAGFAELSVEERAGMKGFADALRAHVDVKSMLPGRFLSAGHRAAHPDHDPLIEGWLDLAPISTLIEELDDIAVVPSLLPRLRDLDCPVYARTGALDAAIPAEHALAIAAAVREGHVEIVPGVGHALLLEDAVGTLATIRRACGVAA